MRQTVLRWLAENVSIQPSDKAVLSFLGFRGSLAGVQ